MRDLPPVESGGDIAAWARAVNDQLKAQRVTVDGSSGLEAHAGPHGTALRIATLAGGGGGGGRLGAFAGTVGSGGFAPGSIGSPSIGSVILYNYDETTPSPGDEVNVKNPFAVAITAGSTVVVVPTSGGNWILVSVECAG